jgi:hypothetical protein
MKHRLQDPPKNGSNEPTLPVKHSVWLWRRSRQREKKVSVFSAASLFFLPRPSRHRRSSCRRPRTGRRRTSHAFRSSAIDRRMLVLRGGTLIDGTGARPSRTPSWRQGDRIVDAGSSSRVQALAGARTFRQVSSFRTHRPPSALHAGGATISTLPAPMRVGYPGMLSSSAARGGIAVRDMGTRNDLALLKEAVDRKMIEGPRIFWSGQLSPPRRPRRRDHLDRDRPAARRRQSRIGRHRPDDRRCGAEQIRNGADWIKVTAPYSKKSPRRSTKRTCASVAPTLSAVRGHGGGSRPRLGRAPSRHLRRRHRS